MDERIFRAAVYTLGGYTHELEEDITADGNYAEKGDDRVSTNFQAKLLKNEVVLLLLQLRSQSNSPQIGALMQNGKQCTLDMTQRHERRNSHRFEDHTLGCSFLLESELR